MVELTYSLDVGRNLNIFPLLLLFHDIYNIEGWLLWKVWVEIMYVPLFNQYLLVWVLRYTEIESISCAAPQKQVQNANIIYSPLHGRAP